VNQGQNAGQVYLCPMHSEVRQANPGKCPKCGMDLLPEGTRFALLRHMVHAFMRLTSARRRAHLLRRQPDAPAVPGEHPLDTEPLRRLPEYQRSSSCFSSRRWVRAATTRSPT